MTPERARELIGLNVYCVGLPWAFDKYSNDEKFRYAWGYDHSRGITKQEDFFINTVWARLDDTKSYFDALEHIAGVSKMPLPRPRN